MKKLPKIIGVLTLLLSVFIGFGALVNTDAHAQTDDATVILHKKMMAEFPNPFIQNTGMEMDEFDGYEDYTDGVDFSVYDVTDDFYTRRAAGDTVDQALAFVQALSPGGTAFRTGTTDTDGKLTLTIPKKDSDGRDAIYLFIESPKAGVTIAANMVVAFPVYALNSDGGYTDNELDSVHLYPKNVVAADGSLTVTKRGTANDELLNGAKFIIKSNATNRYLAGSSNGFFTWVDNVNGAFEFETGFSYTNSLTPVVGSTGILGISGFTPGDYTLIETEAPYNAAMIDDETVKDFTITAGQELSTTVNVLNDTIDLTKDHLGLSFDYNIGESISYGASVNIPLGIRDKLANGDFKHPALIITDIPVSGLMYNDDLVVKINDVIFDTTGMITLTTNGFVLTIPAAALDDFAGENLDLAYTMHLDGTATPDLGYNNTMNVDTDLLEDEDDTDDVFTGGKRFIKIDANFDENNALEGAIFVVRDSDADDAKYLTIGANNAVSWVDDLEDATKFDSDAFGIVKVMGLSYGTYWLEEIEAPTDYVLREDRLEFSITKYSYMNGDVLVDAMEVINVRKGRLPSTGGSGIMGIVGVGVLLVLTTGGYYYKRQQDA